MVDWVLKYKNFLKTNIAQAYYFQFKGYFPRLLSYLNQRKLREGPAIVALFFRGSNSTIPEATQLEGSIYSVQGCP